MPVIPGSALQQRIAQRERQLKRPQSSGRNSLAVRIIQAFDSDVLDADGIPDELAPMIAREPGTLWARVEAIRSKRKFYVAFQASEAEILKTHGNSVLLAGQRGTIIYNGMRPEEGRLALQGEPTRPLRNSSASTVFDVVSFL